MSIGNNELIAGTHWTREGWRRFNQAVASVGDLIARRNPDPGLQALRIERVEKQPEEKAGQSPVVRVRP